MFCVELLQCRAPLLRQSPPRTSHSSHHSGVRTVSTACHLSQPRHSHQDKYKQQTRSREDRQCVHSCHCEQLQMLLSACGCVCPCNCSRVRVCVLCVCVSVSLSVCVCQGDLHPAVQGSWQPSIVSRRRDHTTDTAAVTDSLPHFPTVGD